MSKQKTVGALVLGDVVKLFEGAYGTGHVSKIDDKQVTIMRPYGATAGFTYGGDGTPDNGSAIFYTGLETCQYLKTSNSTFEVYHTEKLK